MTAPWPIGRDPETCCAVRGAQDYLDAAEACILSNKHAMKMIQEFCGSEASCTNYGALTTEIASRIGFSTGQTFGGLEYLVKTGAMLRYPQGDARGRIIRWWPVGLYERIKAAAK